MESLKGKTRGEDLYDRVSAVIENMKLPWSKLINVTTDGSPNLTGKNVGLLRRIQNKVKDENPDQVVIFLHRIIHQESLCKSVLQLNHVVNPVVKLVNFIRARGLQHRQFITFLEETDADHQDLLYHSRVRWLSLGKVFQRVWELKEEIGAFLELLRKAGEFPELSNKSWLCDFAFAVDIFSHMNELNVKLQGKDQFVHDMYTKVKAFKSKLAFFSRQISNKLFTHFPTLATLEEAGANHLQSLLDHFPQACKGFGLTISLKKTNSLGQDLKALSVIAIDNYKLDVVSGSTFSDNISLDAEIGHLRHIAKDILYNELALGKRTSGCTQLCYKDVCNREMKVLNINIESWEEIAVDSTK
ncbi:general transcription factor II-I repeat domain-containing protein 2A-like [Hypanus sabinus]|uniref:general transcription factor II-I repeat domain-containing protein 2A-like n=1 Tax=Hypanus sabinus TaxID=79690 RepID=UPI0028C42B12|nr:general transcription factor II-I repeat domain-containing protein 2A-like [Hypanus sabinus]